ncbi:MAG: hypothetical protein J7J20_00005, partial [Desulfurococcales archaeon]|nr:hypothetical protein [Desulfurococcales archaeon]
MVTSSRVSRGSIAVVGDELFVLGFRIAGARKYFIVDVSAPEDLLRNELARIFNSIYNDPEVNLVIVHDSLKNIVDKIRKALTHPLVIYVPDIKTASKMDIKEFYSSLIRRYLGISLELG